MNRKQREYNKRLFKREAAIVSFLQGAVVLAAVAAIFFLALNNGLGEASARTMAFTTIVISNLALITVNRLIGLGSAVS